KEGTAFLTVAYDGLAATADQVDLTVSVGPRPPVTRTLAHAPGATQGSVEIDFASGYPSGQTIVVDVLARQGGAVVGRGHAGATLDGACRAFSVEVQVTGPPPDAAMADQAAADAFVM